MTATVIMEEREELTAPPTGGGDATLRIAHFLKPSVSSVDGPVFDIPSISYSFSATNSLPTKRSLKVSFGAWRSPLEDWKAWVDRMNSLYQAVWKQAGIHDAITNSTYKIHRHDDLLFSFVEIWCPQTNTFVLPWCEATITLEDMVILGGYSVLGDSVLTPLKDIEAEEIKGKLIQARKEITRTKSKKANHGTWIAKFMDSGSEIEHEAFLATWLSRFVFASNSFDTVSISVFPIAVYLARGTKIAIAPAVLASLYRDLSLLKSKIVASENMGNGECEYVDKIVKILSPFQLVQAWVWERFPTLHARPNLIECGEPRFALWHDLKNVNIGNIRLAIKNAEEHFHWRPYATTVKNMPFHKFYKEKEEWVTVHDGLDEDMEVLARCLRPSELVGLEKNCIEQYLPHRVAMQFGIDQDLPGHVVRANATPEIAWENYTRPIGDERLYIPSRLFESDVTTRYLNWWRQLRSVGRDKAVVKKQSDMESEAVEEKKVKAEKIKRKILNDAPLTNGDNVRLVPPGFSPKSHKIKGEVPSDDDKYTQAELVRNIQPKNTMQSTPVSSDSEAIQNMQSLVKPVTNMANGALGGSENAMGDSTESHVEAMGENMESTSGKKTDNSNHLAPEITRLEFHINKLENVIAQIKAHKLARRY